MRTINEIIVHCSATPRGVDYTAEDIDRWHKGQGWTRIGYHWVDRLNGQWERGRRESEVGAHARGHNRFSIGICYVGGMDIHNKTPKDTRTAAQKQALEQKIKQLLAKYPTITKITGHKQYAAKACPSFNATLEYAYLLRPGYRPDPNPPKKPPAPKGTICNWGRTKADQWSGRNER